MKRFSWVTISLIILSLVLCVLFAYAAADLNGTWNMDIKTSKGSGKPVFTLKQAGDKITGTYKGRWGEAPITGTVKGNNFEINVTLGKFVHVYKGKVDGNKMSGSVDFAGRDKGDFTGAKK